MSGVSASQTERVFDDKGQTVEELIEETPAEEIVEQEEIPAVAVPAHKYRIGDKTFATQTEALQYAESQVQPNAEVDAYRQVLREVVAGTPRAEPVTPAAPVGLNADEIYTDPAGFLKKYGDQIKSETLNQINQNQATRDADDRVWREFTDRHPDLSDFKEEIRDLAGRISPEVQAVGRTKGPSAAYDYVATKFKAQVERHAAVLKPKRVLPNTPVVSASGDMVETVTSKSRDKKPLSFSEQIRQIRKRR